MSSNASDEAAPAPAEPTVLDRTEKLLIKAGQVLNQMQVSSRFQMGIRPDGTCPVFFQDVVQNIALPWADFETSQIHIVARHAPVDEEYLRLFFDLVPTLEGKVLLDVGSFTGTDAMMMRAILNPKETHLFEPQKTMTSGLEKTIAANDAGGDVTLHTDIIDEDGQEMLMSSYNPVRLHQVTYLRRAGGKLRSRSIDSYGFQDVGCICLNFYGDKIYALRGAENVITRDRPVIGVNLIARDFEEINAFLEPLDYMGVGIGKQNYLFVPKS